MRKAKDNKGITLVALILMIIVLIILASVSIYSGFSTVRYAIFMQAKAQVEAVQVAVSEWNQKYLNGDEKYLEYGTNDTTYAEYEESFDGAGVSADRASRYRFFSFKDLEEKYEIGGVEYDFLINVRDGKIIVVDGIKYEDKKYFTPQDLGISAVDNNPIRVVDFDLSVETSINNAEEVDIIVSNVKFYDNEKEVNVSKFNIEYFNDGQTWNTEMKINKASSADYITYNGEKAYKLPVYKSGNYDVRILDTDGRILYTRDNERKNIEVTIVPDYWQVIDHTKKSEWYAYKDTNGSTAQVNAPELGAGMLAIKYIGDGTLTEGSMWANAITKDGSMWVWIPRFAYRITNGYHQGGSELNLAEPKKGAGTIEIAFLNGNTNTFLDTSLTGNVIASGVTDSTYSGNNWILAPGFEFGGQQLKGFWFAKFEASNTVENETDNTNDTNLTLQIKKDFESWDMISAQNMFTVCLNMTNDSIYNTYFNNITNIDTHMTKNTEWGAVAYLTHSTYGLNRKELIANVQDITGRADSDNPYNSLDGINASTTKNVYGIYDMNGGVAEAVAACLEGEGSNKNAYVGNILTTVTEENISKYINMYKESDYGTGITKFGDAMYETSGDIVEPNKNSWFGDSSYYITEDKPIFTRGGYYNEINDAQGIFNFGSYAGDANGITGFRPVCVVY